MDTNNGTILFICPAHGNVKVETLWNIYPASNYSAVTDSNGKLAELTVNCLYICSVRDFSLIIFTLSLNMYIYSRIPPINFSMNWTI